MSTPTVDVLRAPLDAADVLRDDATLGTPAHDDPGMVKPWTEDTILAALWRHFTAGGWAPIPQVTVALRDLDHRADLSGWDRRHALADRDGWTDRRIDLLLARPARKAGIGPLETLAVEVKVTRADFANDLRHPEKQAPWRKAAHRHAYATPAGLVTRTEVPTGSGLLAVKHAPYDRATVEWAVRAPYTPGHNPALPTRVHVAFAHRLAALEARTRGWTHDAPDDDPQALRAALTAAQKAADRAEKAAARERGKAEAWRTAHALATPDGHPCRWCGHPLKPLHPGGGIFKSWKHPDPEHAAACEAAEHATREAEARSAYDAADDTARRSEARYVMRHGFTPLIEAEPWRAFLPPNYQNPGHPLTGGPEPANVEPPGAPG